MRHTDQARSGPAKPGGRHADLQANEPRTSLNRRSEVADDWDRRDEHSDPTGQPGAGQAWLPAPIMVGSVCRSLAYPDSSDLVSTPASLPDA